jgi:hypothetical protein
MRIVPGGTPVCCSSLADRVRSAGWPRRTVRLLFLACSTLVSWQMAAPPPINAADRVYRHQLTRIPNPLPILADYPEFVEPVREQHRFEAPRLIDDPSATLSVRAWRFSYNARGIIEFPNALDGAKTAVIVVHPWGLDDGQGWRSPEPAGAGFQCTPERNRFLSTHLEQVVNPLLKQLRPHVAAVMYSLPRKEDPIRHKLYRSIRQTPSEAERVAGQRELTQALQEFDYTAEPLPIEFTVSEDRAVIDYYGSIPGLDAGPKYNNPGFWELPTPVHAAIDVDPKDIVIYDGDGYPVLRDYLKSQGIRHVLLTGYNTDMCVCLTTAGSENLRQDFNVFLVGDATLATFPGQPTPAVPTTAAVAFASLKVPVTQVSWIKAVDSRTAADRAP